MPQLNLNFSDIPIPETCLWEQLDLLKGKTVGVDATTLEANAAMRSIVRRDNGASYDEFLAELARESGITTPAETTWPV
jgi:hypothetical protein